MKTQFLYALYLLLIWSPIAKAQDSLLTEDLAAFVYHFELSDGQLTGAGADLLKNEAMKTQYFLIGEYHGSSHISNFTRAMLPILHEAGYRNFGVEVGPHSAEILQELSKNADETYERLKAFNERYILKTQDGDQWEPIPFFKSEADAGFLAQSSKQSWNIFGLDQEFYFSYLPLVDKIYKQLTPDQQKALGALHQQVRDSIQIYYKMDDLEQKQLPVALTQSKLLQDFLEKAANKHPENAEIADAIRKTIQIYYFNTTRQYLACNATRIDYMKENLGKAFDRYAFDLETDKMLLKMGGIHTAKGFSWLSLYELGNTLHELAAFHGNQSVHLTFSNRFSEEDGKVIDELDDPKGYGYRYIDLLQFGQKDQWTIIDLRPLKEKIYYHRKYEISDLMKEFFQQHDLFVIAPIERE